MKRVYFLIVVLVLVGLVCAKDFEFYEGYVEKSYTGGQFVKGELNMSFDEQENIRFESNFEGGVELYSLLGKMNYSEGVDFSCEPVSCVERYVVGDGGPIDLESREFTLDGTRLFGFEVNGGDLETEGIKDFKLNITSDEPASCSNQVSIDLFDNGIIDFYNTKYVDSVCGSIKYGGGSECYDDESAEDTKIEDNEDYFCQKIKLPVGPAYKVGVKMKKGRDESGSDKGPAMILSTFDGDEWVFRDEQGGFCRLDLNDASTEEFRNVDCIVNYSTLEEIEAFVCILDDSYEDSKVAHTIREDDSGSRHCGGAGKGPNNVDIETDFAIYAVPLRYDEIKKVKFDNVLYKKLHDGAEIYDLIEEYIEDTYEGDCDDIECIIPFKIGGVNGQQITLDDAKIRYDIGRTKTSNDIYDIEKEPFLISSDEDAPLTLDIEKMRFKVPNKDKADQRFWIKFDDDDELIDEEISITKGFEFTIGPRFALVKQSTQFTAYPSTDMNITGSVWKFTETVSLPSANEKSAYTYLESGEHEIEVTLTADDGRVATKRFVIIVGEPQLSAQLTLNKYKQRVTDIEADIVGFDDWIKAEITSLLNLEQTKNSLISIENDFKKLKSTDSNEKFIKIINDLIVLELPKSVDVVQRGTLPGEIGFANINVNHIKTISGGTATYAEEDLVAGIISWSDANYGFEISFESIAVREDFGTTGLLNKYKISLVPKVGAGSDEAYLIIGQPYDSVDFKQATYGQEKIGAGEGTSINLGTDRSIRNFEFLIAGAAAPSVTSLGVYISPKINVLDVVQRPTEILVDGFPWGFFLIALIILVVFIFVAYIVLQEWYKRYYEKSLFKNPDNLYNIINFIYNSRASGLKDREIKKKLLGQRWKREQVNYAFRKIDGKRTGMWEVPIFKFFENKKVKKEIQKKHPGQRVDARFIKRSNL